MASFRSVADVKLSVVIIRFKDDLFGVSEFVMFFVFFNLVELFVNVFQIPVNARYASSQFPVHPHVLFDVLVEKFDSAINVSGLRLDLFDPLKQYGFVQQRVNVNQNERNNDSNDRRYNCRLGQ